MAHEVETHQDQAAAVFARQDAWHKLGTTLAGAFTAEEAMQIGHLGGWNVRKSRLFSIEDFGGGGFMQVDVPDRWATIRTNPFTKEPDYLGVVGPAYTPIQNEEHAEFLNTLCDVAGANFETAVSLRGGAEVCITMKLPRGVLVGGVDPIDLYLAAFNSHDGSSAFRLMTTPVRVVCANTQKMALGRNNGVHSIRHTAGATAAVQRAREALKLSFEYIADFEEQAERMIQASLTDGAFMDIIRAEFGPAEDATPRSVTMAARRVDQLQELFMDAKTHVTVRNSRWAGYQALIEYADHFAPVRAGGGSVSEARAERVLTGGADAFKHRALELFAV